jgi:hypothetical protein
VYGLDDFPICKIEGQRQSPGAEATKPSHQITIDSNIAKSGLMTGYSQAPNPTKVEIMGEPSVGVSYNIASLV